MLKLPGVPENNVPKVRRAKSTQTRQSAPFKKLKIIFIKNTKKIYISLGLPLQLHPQTNNDP